MTPLEFHQRICVPMERKLGAPANRKSTSKWYRYVHYSHEHPPIFASLHCLAHDLAHHDMGKFKAWLSLWRGSK